MKSLTYNRPYQYVEDLRLFACYRSNEHAVFVGQGFADNAVAFIENGPMLTKLEQQGKVVHGDFDQLITRSFDVVMPFRIYVVNPDDENGKASNAIEYTASSDTPVLDVKVDGKSVVKDQIAVIDLTGKLDVIMKPNKIYGTDADGREAQFDRQQIEGVQHFFLNGEEIPVDMGNVRLIDIAKESKTVQRVSTPLQIYGTNQDGEQATYPRDFFATSSSVDDATKEIQALSENKQDKDKSAKDGYIAIMKNGQSVGSNGNLDDIMNNIMTVQQNLDKLTQKIDKGFVKDWKALSGSDSSILNNPIGDNSIVITDKPIADEKAIRDTPNAVVYGLQPDKISDFGTAMGTRNATGNYGVAMGAIATAKGDSAVAVGSLATATGDNSTSIGKNSSVTGKGSVALGFNSLADRDNTVSVGYDTTDPQKTPTYRRITAVDVPEKPHDAANKAYVDSNGGESEYTKTFEPISNPYFTPSMGNIDRWTMSFSDGNPTSKPSDVDVSSNIGDLSVLDKNTITYPTSWDKKSIGVIGVPVIETGYSNTTATLMSKEVRVIDDDIYQLSFYAGMYGNSSMFLRAFTLTASVMLKTKSGEDVSIELLNTLCDKIMRDMKYYTFQFNLESLIKTYTDIEYPLDMRIKLTLSCDLKEAGTVYLTGLRLRNIPHVEPVKTLNSASPILNKNLDLSIGNIDGWRYSTKPDTGNWKNATILSSDGIPLDINTGGSGFNSPYYGCMVTVDRESWFVANQFMSPGITEYFFSCWFAPAKGFPSGAQPTVDFGYGYYSDKNGLSFPQYDKTMVGPVNLKLDKSNPTRVYGSLRFNAHYTNLVPVIHVVNPASNGETNSYIYITNISVERTSIETPVSTPYPNFPYITEQGRAVKINQFVYLGIKGRFNTTSSFDVVDEESNLEPLPEDLRPDRTLGDAIINCITSTGKTFSIRIDNNGKMYSTGHIDANAKVFGSTIYPIGDFIRSLSPDEG